MPAHNSDIADVLERTADLLEIKGDNPFRVRAYRTAARTVKSLPRSAADLIADGEDLSDYPGIGKDLAQKIGQIAETGSFDLLEQLKEKIPEQLSRLMGISGLGAKRVGAIYQHLKVTDLEQLKEAVDSGRIRGLEGFGKKTEQNLREGIERLQRHKATRTKLAVVAEIAGPLLDYLGGEKGVVNISAAGSFRRRRETVGDLDILVTCRRGSHIMDRFTAYEDVRKVVSKGRTRCTVLLRSGLQVDVRVVRQASYGAALLYFTGSKEHNIAVRKIGVQKNFKLNEYGLFNGRKRVAGKSEAEVYKKIGLSYIEPELRENRGEVEAAQDNNLPELVRPDHIKGDLHIHTKYTDGHNTIEEMARAAQNLGYSYIAITDHSQHVTVAGGLRPKELRKQLEEIDRINDKLDSVTILKGSEVDILADGGLDLPNEVLEELDLCVCAVHYKFNLPRQQQTERIIRAMDNRYFNILAHPTGRLINERPGYDVDTERIITAAAERGCLLELNAHPDRLDLNDIYCKMAKDMGVKVAVSTDSHQAAHLNYMRFGIGQARRGWLEPEDIANTRSIGRLKSLLKR